jgi:hypothetical protein
MLDSLTARPRRTADRTLPNGGSARGYLGCWRGPQQSRYDLLDGPLLCISIHRHLWGEYPHLPHSGRAGAGVGCTEARAVSSRATYHVLLAPLAGAAAPSARRRAVSSVRRLARPQAGSGAYIQPRSRPGLLVRRCSRAGPHPVAACAGWYRLIDVGRRGEVLDKFRFCRPPGTPCRNDDACKPIQQPGLGGREALSGCSAARQRRRWPCR